MIQKDLVSVTLVTYNSGRFIRRCLESVLEQNYQHLEVTVIDNASTDGTADALVERGHTVVTGPNMGVCWNKNRALFYLYEVAKCDVILLLEDDTFPTKDGWESVWIQAATKFGHIGLAGTWFKDKFTAGNGDVDNPYLSSVLSGQCVGFAAKCLSYVGYLDTRFKGYGVGHAEHSMRCVRAGYGGEIEVDGERENYTFYLINSDLTVMDPGGNRRPEQIARNHEVLSSIAGEPIYRRCWRNDDEMLQMRSEMENIRIAKSAPAGISPLADLAAGFDEQFYLSRYPDVAESVRKGVFTSGLQHYEQYGRRENRATTNIVGVEETEQPLQTALQPSMTPREQELFVSFLRCSKRYLEFGTGGSTIWAVKHVSQSVISVDSSRDWQLKVARSCAMTGARVVPSLVHIDCGPVGDWGYPLDDTLRSQWPDYFSAVWDQPEASMSDLCLVDGRFRVASFISVLLHCSPLAVVMFHDFDRQPYHVVRQFGDQIAAAESLAVFRRSSDFDSDRALSVLEQFRFHPA